MDRRKKNSNQTASYGLIPPQAVLFEEALLGTILTYPKLFDKVNELLFPDCFYKIEHNLIYQAMLNLYNKDKPIDIATTAMELSNMNKLEDVGNHYYIATLLNKTTDRIDYYAIVIYQTFVQRELITLLSFKTNELFQLDANIEKICDEIIDKINELTDKLSVNQTKLIKDTVISTINKLDYVIDNAGDVFWKTGVDLIDNNLYLNEHMIIAIASARGSGKTSYTIKLSKGLLEYNDDMAILWFSFEDDDTKILKSFASSDTSISRLKIDGKKGILSSQELATVKDKLNEYSKYNIEFITEGKPIAEIKRLSYKFIKKYKDKKVFIIIDNIMCIKDIASAPIGQVTAIEDKIYTSIIDIKNKAKHENVKASILFLHHMTKEMEARGQLEEGYRPKLSFMKGSTRAADITDAVILLNKPGTYKDLLKHHSQLPDIKCQNTDGSVIVVNRRKLLENMIIAEIAKNRDGEMADDNKAIERYITDLNIMKFQPLKCIK